MQRISDPSEKRTILSDSQIDASNEAHHRTCPLSAAEIEAWAKKLKLPGAENERRLKRLVTYWFAQAAWLISQPSTSQQARQREYVWRRESLGHAPEKIRLPRHFERIDLWLPEIAEKLMAIHSELVALPGDVAAAVRARFGDYEEVIARINELSQVLTDVAGSWYRPKSGQPSLETSSWAISLLLRGIEDFTGEPFPSPRSDKRLDEIELVRALARKLLPSATTASITTMLMHLHRRRLGEPAPRHPGRRKPEV